MFKFSVYHVNSELLYTDEIKKSSFNVEDQAERLLTFFLEGNNYICVAELKGYYGIRDIEKLMNSDNGWWWLNPDAGACFIGDACRSMAVGDMIIKQHTDTLFQELWLITANGPRKYWEM